MPNKNSRPISTTRTGATNASKKVAVPANGLVKPADSAARIASTLVPGSSVGVRPAPSTADRSGRRPLK